MARGLWCVAAAGLVCYVTIEGWWDVWMVFLTGVAVASTAGIVWMVTRQVREPRDRPVGWVLLLTAYAYLAPITLGLLALRIGLR